MMDRLIQDDLIRLIIHTTNNTNTTNTNNNTSTNTNMTTTTTTLQYNEQKWHQWVPSIESLSSEIEQMTRHMEATVKLLRKLSYLTILKVIKSHMVASQGNNSMLLPTQKSVLIYWFRQFCTFCIPVHPEQVIHSLHCSPNFAFSVEKLTRSGNGVDPQYEMIKIWFKHHDDDDAGGQQPKPFVNNNNKCIKEEEGDDGDDNMCMENERQYTSMVAENNSSNTAPKSNVQMMTAPFGGVPTVTMAMTNRHSCECLDQNVGTGQGDSVCNCCSRPFNFSQKSQREVSSNSGNSGHNSLSQADKGIERKRKFMSTSTLSSSMEMDDVSPSPEASSNSFSLFDNKRMRLR